MNGNRNILSIAVAAMLAAARPQPKPKETIGRCELCGLVDHYLVGAVCPACRVKFAITDEEPSHV